MDILAINEAIEELECADTTISNVQELANLYVVRDHINKEETQLDVRSDILPSYQNYCTIKYKYQRHEVSEESVVDAIDLLCQDLKNFIQTLYCNTDMRKERVAIESVLSTQYMQFCNS